MSRVLVDSGIGYLGNIPSEWNIFRIKVTLILLFEIFSLKK